MNSKKNKTCAWCTKIVYDEQSLCVPCRDKRKVRYRQKQRKDNTETQYKVVLEKEIVNLHPLMTDEQSDHRIQLSDLIIDNVVSMHVYQMYPDAVLAKRGRTHVCNIDLIYGSTSSHHQLRSCATDYKLQLNGHVYGQSKDGCIRFDNDEIGSKNVFDRQYAAYFAKYFSKTKSFPNTTEYINLSRIDSIVLLMNEKDIVYKKGHYQNIDTYIKLTTQNHCEFLYRLPSPYKTVCLSLTGLVHSIHVEAPAQYQHYCMHRLRKKQYTTPMVHIPYDPNYRHQSYTATEGVVCMRDVVKDIQQNDPQFIKAIQQSTRNSYINATHRQTSIDLSRLPQPCVLEFQHKLPITDPLKVSVYKYRILEKRPNKQYYHALFS